MISGELMMLHETVDHESIAELLRAEREQLILAWEELEKEQRRLASSRVYEPAGVPTEAPSLSHTSLKDNASNTVQRTTPTETKLNAKSIVSNTFRLLQREFDQK